MQSEFLFTSESVAEGHPDKICAQISDACLDSIISIENNPENCRSAVECLTTTQHLTLAGEIQLAYVIGWKEPISIMVRTFGTGKIPYEQLVNIVKKAFDLSPKGIIARLYLYRPIDFTLRAFWT